MQEARLRALKGRLKALQGSETETVESQKEINILLDEKSLICPLDNILQKASKMIDSAQTLAGTNALLHDRVEGTIFRRRDR